MPTVFSFRQLSLLSRSTQDTRNLKEASRKLASGPLNSTILPLGREKKETWEKWWQKWPFWPICCDLCDPKSCKWPPPRLIVASIYPVWSSFGVPLEYFWAWPWQWFSSVLRHGLFSMCSIPISNQFLLYPDSYLVAPDMVFAMSYMHHIHLYWSMSIYSRSSVPSGIPGLLFPAHQHLEFSQKDCETSSCLCNDCNQEVWAQWWSNSQEPYRCQTIQVVFLLR